MSTHALRPILPAAILAACALSAGGAAASDSPPVPQEMAEIAEPISVIADIVEKAPGVASEDRDRVPARSTSVGSAEAAAGTGEGAEAATVVPGAKADRLTGISRVAEGEVPPASRLLRSLDAWAARPAPATPTPAAEGAFPDAARPGGEAQFGGVLHGCPRALLSSLLESAADTGDTVSALAIERETLALCRERQEIVNGIVALEGELKALLAEAQGGVVASGTEAGTAGTTDASIVKVSAPVRVIEMPAPPPVPAETAEMAERPAPQPPLYSWFSIVGTAGDLRAGVGGGAGNAGTNVWFVREGDRLPGGVTVMRIVARPPGVHVGGAVEAALPYKPRPFGTAGRRENTPLGGSTPSGGSTPPGGYTPSGGDTAGDGS